MSDTSLMHAAGGSDGCAVPEKDPNKGGLPQAEGLEGRRPIKERGPLWGRRAKHEPDAGTGNRVTWTRRCAGSGEEG